MQFVQLRSHLGDSTAAHSFNADPNAKGTEAILAKAAQEVSYSKTLICVYDVLSHDTPALFDCFYFSAFNMMRDLPISLLPLLLGPFYSQILRVRRCIIYPKFSLDLLLEQVIACQNKQRACFD